jgi:hypothetical protein
MIKGRKSLYLALMDAFDEGEVFTLQQATNVQVVNIYPIDDGFVKENVSGELARFVVDGRLVKIKRGVYKLTPRMIDYEHALLTKPKTPKIIQVKGQRKDLAGMVTNVHM